MIPGSRNYCAENGYFCPFMDGHGFCIATSCRSGQMLLEQIDIDRQAQAIREIEEGRLWRDYLSLDFCNDVEE